MNVLLIFPKSGHDVKGVSMEYPAGMLAVAAPLLKDGHRVTLIDQRVDLQFTSTLERALEDEVDVVGLSCMTGRQIRFALDIARRVRERCPEVPIVWGGIHPSLMPHQTMENPLVDVIVRGEGEETFAEFVATARNRSRWSDIRGLSYKENGSIIDTPDRAFIDLNAQPATPYDLIDMEPYVMAQLPGATRCLDVYTSRGCPGHCTFCYNQAFNRRRWRPYRTERILADIRLLTERYHLDAIFFQDDNMFVDLKRVYDICEGLRNEGLGLRWASQGARIDNLEHCDLAILEASGCTHLYIGIETGSERILSWLQKGITLEQVRRVVRAFTASTIIPHYNFMIGYPGESREDLAATLSLIDWIFETDPKAYISSLHISTPYPGTPYYEEAVRLGMPPPKCLEDWADFFWETRNIPWTDAKEKHILTNLSLISYFIDQKVEDRLGNRFLFRWGARCYGALARFRWHRRAFGFCPEFRLLKWLSEKAILE